MPTVTSVFPTTGQVGTRVRIIGTGFVATPRVMFGTTLATTVVFVSATQIYAFVPHVATAGYDVKVINPDLSEGTLADAFEVIPLGGWGLQPYGMSPFGGAVSGAVSIAKALAISTREVDVTTTGLVQDNSPFLVGDALNPSTWQVQRLDSLEFLHVVGVTQVGTNVYRLLCLEEFGPVLVTHRASTLTLKDAGGALVVSPRQADFLGILDEDKASNSAKLAARKVTARDFSNPQGQSQENFGGTLVIDAGGDYQTVTGAELVKKLILRRLMTRPRDFFHLPTYGLGLRVKEPIPTADLGRLVSAIEQQVLEEEEVEVATARVTLQPSTGILTVQVRARLRVTGEEVSVGYTPTDTGVVL